MGGACGTHVVEERCIQGCGGESEGMVPLELGVDGAIILEWVLKEIGWGLSTGTGRTLMNMVMRHQVP